MFSGLIHSIFMSNNYAQLALLSLMKLMLIIALIFYSKKFKRLRIKFIFYSYSLYLIIGIAFDSILMASKL